MKKLLTVTVLVFLSGFVLASGSGDNPHIVHADIDLKDEASMQRGAQIFMNNCFACHSLKYLRYNRLAEDLEMTEEQVQKNLMFNSNKIGEQIISSINQDQAKEWFGAIPPDLTLEARLRSSDWLYSYLTSFYADEKRPFGYNNHVFENVAMPHVLAGMETELGEDKFKAAMLDLTNFLTYAAEPTRTYREGLGVWVLLFLMILFVPIYFLDKEYWKDIH